MVGQGKELMIPIDQHGKPNPPKLGIPALESRLLADRFGAIPVDEFPLITYEELSAIARCNVQSDRGRGYLSTARSLVLREKGYVFRPERNIGMKRMTAMEISKGCSYERITHVRRTHKAGLREQETVDLEKLPEGERSGHIGRISLMAMTVHTHRGDNIKKLEAAANGATKTLPLQQTLEAFKQ